MYANYGNLVDADASGAKASTKHLESRSEVIQGHTFGITENRQRTAYRYYTYNSLMWALESEISKERTEHLRFREPHVIRRPLSREPRRIFAQTLGLYS